MTAADEFSLLVDNAAEAGLPWSGPPTVRRQSVLIEPSPRPGGPGEEPPEATGEGRAISALQWGSGPPVLVLLHGGGQNAHTWDTVALALDRPLVAVDLPGHGHSGWRDDHQYTPTAMAADLAMALGRLAPHARMVVGMSLGGLTALCLAANHPELVERLVLVDITPGTDAAKAEPILAFLSGPERFPSFEAMLARTVAFNATRSESSLRRGVIHNSRQFPDGSWGWRWDPSARWVAPPAVSPAPAPSPSGAVSPARAVSPAPTVSGGGRFGSLWPAVDAVRAPILLLRGARSSVVSDHDVSELRRRQPAAEVEIVPDAGHSIQGDQPIELARRLNRFLEL